MAEISMGKKRLTYAWFTMMFLLFMLICTAIAAATYNDHCSDGSPGCKRGLGFIAMWNVLFSMLLSWGGTQTFRKYQNSMAVGVLMGVLCMMSMNMLTQFAFFVELGQDAEVGGDKDHHTDNAMALFSFLLFIMYGVVAGMLYAYRADVIKKPYETGDAPVGDPAADVKSIVDASKTSTNV